MTTPAPTTARRLRTWAALALAIAVAARALFVIGSSAHAAGKVPLEPDLVTRGQARLSCFRPIIAHSAKVGYLDEDPASSTWFLIAQYTLAPVAMEQSINHRYVVANFPSDERVLAAIASAPVKLKIVANFGEGRALLENQDVPP